MRKYLIAAAIMLLATNANARNENIVNEIGKIGFAAEHCKFPLTEGYKKARSELWNGKRGQWFQDNYNEGYNQARALALMGGDFFCVSSCIAHGPNSPSARMGRQSFAQCGQ